MKAIPFDSGMESVARRCVWFQSPAETLSDPIRFVAYVLTYGTFEEVHALRNHVSNDDSREALNNAPPGVFDARSWAYWNLMLENDNKRPLPQRRFE